MKRILTAVVFVFMLMSGSAQSRALVGSKFTHTYPISSAVIMRSLTFVNDSMAVFVTGSLNNIEGTQVDTLRYSFASDTITFLSSKELDKSLMVQMRLVGPRERK